MNTRIAVWFLLLASGLAIGQTANSPQSDLVRRDTLAAPSKGDYVWAACDKEQNYYVGVYYAGVVGVDRRRMAAVLKFDK